MIIYQLDPWQYILGTGFTLGVCLFGGGKLSKNADPDKCSCCSYDIGFDMRLELSLTEW